MKPLIELVVVTGLAVTGCSRSSNVVEAPMMSVDASAALIANEAPSPGRLQPHAGNRFVGTYRCAQGTTKLTIAIDDVGRGDDEMPVEARFEFEFDGDDDDDDGDEARGAFRLRGKYEAKSRRLVLEPDAWVGDPPDHYVMVGVRGTLGKNGDSFVGTVQGPGCTTFETKLDPTTAGR